MSMDGCSSGFDREQRDLFLDDKLIAALERIEQEASLRLAGIENLTHCPFCDFQAECPPVEVDKEFRCQNPGCEIISCRLCKDETHIPKSCEEAIRENGFSARRVIEEAMSAALIRKCNKCGIISALVYYIGADCYRWYPFHQGKRLQQNDLYGTRMQECPVLRVLQVLRLRALRRQVERWQDWQLPPLRP